MTEENAQQNMILPASIIVAALIISGTMLYVSGDLSLKVTGLTTAISGLTGDNPITDPSPSPTPPTDPAPQPPSGPNIDMQELVDDDPAKGSADATVTIVEFSDFQCPYCGRAVPTVKQIVDTYGDSVRIVYRDFPLGFHQYAQEAAEAAECADDQGLFWQYHDTLFDNQAALDTASLKQYAADLGLDATAFNSCLDSGKYTDEVKQDVADGQAVGVSGTPTFFINGQKLVGAQPFSAFQAVIDPLLE